MDLQAVYRAVRDALVLARGVVRLNRPHRIAADVLAIFREALAEDSTLRRLRSQHERIQGELTREVTSERRSWGKVARLRVHQAHQAIADAKAEITRRRQDVSITFDSFGESFRISDPLQLGVYMELRRPVLEGMTLQELEATHRAGLRRKDALGYADCSLVEERRRGGRVHAASAEEISALKAFDQYIEEIEILRLPSDVPDFEALDADIRRVMSRFDLLKVEAVREVTEEESAALAEATDQIRQAGEPDDTADLQALRKELAEPKAS